MVIKDTYREVEIILLEDENKWRFTANGRERTAPTLPKAREYIDNALDAVKGKKEKQWEPIPAWKSAPFDKQKFTRVTITALAEGRRYSGPEVWVKSDVDGKRSKEDLNLLFADTDANAEAIRRIQQLESEIKRVTGEMGELREKMDRITLPNTQAASA